LLVLRLQGSTEMYFIYVFIPLLALLTYLLWTCSLSGGSNSCNASSYSKRPSLLLTLPFPPISFRVVWSWQGSCEAVVSPSRGSLVHFGAGAIHPNEATELGGVLSGHRLAKEDSSCCSTCSFDRDSRVTDGCPLFDHHSVPFSVVHHYSFLDSHPFFCSPSGGGNGGSGDGRVMHLSLQGLGSGGS